MNPRGRIKLCYWIDRQER